MNEMTVTNLEVGMEFKNYKTLCEFLGVKPKGGNGKIKQLKDFKQYFNWETKGQKITITEIYGEFQYQEYDRGKHPNAQKALKKHNEEVGYFVGDNEDLLQEVARVMQVRERLCQSGLSLENYIYLKDNVVPKRDELLEKQYEIIYHVNQNWDNDDVLEELEQEMVEVRSQIEELNEQLKRYDNTYEDLTIPTKKVFVLLGLCNAYRDELEQSRKGFSTKFIEEYGDDMSKWCLEKTSDYVFGNQYTLLQQQSLKVFNVEHTKVVYTKTDVDGNSTMNNIDAHLVDTLKTKKFHDFDMGYLPESTFLNMCEQKALEHYNIEKGTSYKNINSIYQNAKKDDIQYFYEIENRIITEHYPDYLFARGVIKFNNTIDSCLELKKDIKTTTELNDYYMDLKSQVNNVFYGRKMDYAIKYYNKLETDAEKKEFLKDRLSEEEKEHMFALIKFSYSIDLTELDLETIKKLIHVTTKSSPKRQSFKEVTKKQQDSKHKTDSSSFKRVPLGVTTKPVNDDELNFNSSEVVSYEKYRLTKKVVNGKTEKVAYLIRVNEYGEVLEVLKEMTWEEYKNREREPRRKRPTFRPAE